MQGVGEQEHQILHLQHKTGVGAVTGGGLEKGMQLLNLLDWLKLLSLLKYINLLTLPNLYNLLLLK